MLTTLIVGAALCYLIPRGITALDRAKRRAEMAHHGRGVRLA